MLNVHFSLKKLHEITENALAAIDSNYWKKCVAKVFEEIQLYIELDNANTPAIEEENETETTASVSESHNDLFSSYSGFLDAVVQRDAARPASPQATSPSPVAVPEFCIEVVIPAVQCDSISIEEDRFLFSTAAVGQAGVGGKFSPTCQDSLNPDSPHASTSSGVSSCNSDALLSNLASDHSYGKKIETQSDLRSLVIKQCTKDLISPPKLAQLHNLHVKTITRWIISSGASLPKHYNQTLAVDDTYANHTQSSTPIQTNLAIDSSVNDFAQSDHQYCSPNKPLPLQGSDKNQPKFKCLKCDYETNTKYYYETHIKSHYECDQCGQSFSGAYSKRNFEQHLKLHKKKQEFLCDFCQKPFSSNWYLKKHQLSCKKK